MKNKILCITRNVIPYVKELRHLKQVKSVTTAILMQQLDYWFEKYPDGFYKFMQPCPNNEAYTEGDSWVEELAFSCDEYRTAFDAIGKRYTSKTAWKNAEDKFEGKYYYCSYQDKSTGLTWYFRNHELVDSLLDNLQTVNKDICQPSVRPVLTKSPQCSLPVTGSEAATSVNSRLIVDRQSQSTVDGQPQSLEMGNPNLCRLATPISRDGQCQSTLYTEITSEITLETTPSNIEDRGEQSQQEEGKSFSGNKLNKLESNQRNDMAADAQIGGAALADYLSQFKPAKKSNAESVDPTSYKSFKSKPLYSWRNSWDSNDFDLGFVEYLMVKHLPFTRYFRDKQSTTTGDAKSWINKRESNEQDLADIEARWSDYCDWRNQEVTQKAINKESALSAYEDIPNFSMYRPDWHETKAKEYLEIGEEAFKQKYTWHEDWYYHLERSPSHLNRLLVQIGKVPEAPPLLLKRIYNESA